MKADETFHTILARFARAQNALHALPETLHVLPETLNGLYETILAWNPHAFFE